MPDWIFQLIGLAGTAGAIYGAIRADLKAAYECALEAKAIGIDARNKLFEHVAGHRG